MIHGERASAAITTVLLLPLLVTVLLGVAQIGALRVLAARVASAADLATVAATDDQDEAALATTGVLRLAPDASAVARRYFALNLGPVASQLAVSPDAAAGAADVEVFPYAPSVDPMTGSRYDRPTVRLVASVPIRTPLFAALLLPDRVLVNVRAASSPR